MESFYVHTQQYFTPPFTIYPAFAPMTALFGLASSALADKKYPHLREVFAEETHQIQFSVVRTPGQQFSVRTKGYLKKRAPDYESLTPDVSFFTALQIISMLHDENAPLNERHVGRVLPHHTNNLRLLNQYRENGYVPGLLTSKSLQLPDAINYTDPFRFSEKVGTHMAQFKSNKRTMADYLTQHDRMSEMAFALGDGIKPCTSFFAMSHKGQYLLYALSPIADWKIGTATNMDMACVGLSILEKTYLEPNMTLRDRDLPTPVMHYSQWCDHDVAAECDAQKKFMRKNAGPAMNWVS